MIKIKYVGVRPVYRENLYGTGIVFDKDQVVEVETSTAIKMLKHQDQYVRAEADEVAVDPVVIDPPEDKGEEEENAQTTRDTIATMDKAALESFAKVHFSVDLDKRKGLGTLRAQVVGLVDQYGLE